MKLDAVIFDLYGTLVDDFGSSIGQLHADFVKTLAVPPDAFMNLWKETTEMRIVGTFRTVEASIEYVCNLLGARITIEQLTQAVEIRLQLIRQTLTPRPEALATLTRIKNNGYKIGLLSNCSIEIPIVWPQTSFAEFVDFAIFSCQEGLKKPDPRIYAVACERLGVPPEGCLYIADGENYELTAASKIGLRCLLLQNSSRDNHTELLREAREWQGDSIVNLPDVLQRL